MNRPSMSKEEMRAGLAQGRNLIQEEWSTAEEIKAVDELVTEGVCTVTEWAYKDNFQCSMRRVMGIKK